MKRDDEKLHGVAEFIVSALMAAVILFLTLRFVGVL